MKEQTKSEAAIKNKSTLYYCIYWCVIGMLIGASVALLIDYSRYSEVRDIISDQGELIHNQKEDIETLTNNYIDCGGRYRDAVAQKKELSEELGLQLLLILKDDEMGDLILDAYERETSNLTEDEQKEMELELEVAKKEFEVDKKDFKEEFGYE